ncbi:MAG: RsmB/NOP family class I SAM-dependent RNA methyltransferase [Burkholderiales bacterium]|nr:RsmB/NOP family class I SAM-dependent RNA methyltransferase [Burkholderiales bacterium]
MKKLNGMRIDLAVDALRRILPLNEPVDVGLRHFFQDMKTGRGERAFVAEAVFGILRRKYFLDHVISAVDGKSGTPRKLLLAYLSRVEGMNLRELEHYLSESEKKWLSEVKAVQAGSLSLEVKSELPEWVVRKLRNSMSDEEILALGRGLQGRAPFDLRVNTIKARREEILERLEGEAMKWSPIGIRISDRVALNEHDFFLEGKVEVQDEGSQLLGYILSPKRREMVADFCAGAGGKTLMLGALMGSTGRIYAFDVSEKRLARLKPRLKRSGLANVNPVLIANENDIKVKRLSGKIDRVLVDAPCSGLGTLRRNPDLKWRQSEESLMELTQKQASILAGASVLVKPGGRLVYATCSILPEENRGIVENFLKTHPDFELLNCADILAENHIGLDTGKYLELRPDLHGTDGFFAAAMTRKNLRPAEESNVEQAT